MQSAALPGKAASMFPTTSGLTRSKIFSKKERFIYYKCFFITLKSLNYKEEYGTFYSTASFTSVAVVEEVLRSLTIANSKNPAFKILRYIMSKINYYLCRKAHVSCILLLLLLLLLLDYYYSRINV